MSRTRAAALAALILGAALGGAWLWRSGADTGGTGVPLAMEAHPVPWNPARPADTRAGRLHWRGGFVLTANTPDFGGLSGLDVAPDCTRLVAVTDQGHWVTADIVDEAGEFEGLAHGRMGQLAVPGGGRGGKAWTDAEAVVSEDWRVPGHFGRSVLVAFERYARVSRYRLEAAGYAGPPEAVVPPDTLAELFGSGAWSNQGIEALLLLPEADGAPAALLILGEGGADGGGANIAGVLVTGALVTGGTQEVAPVSLRRRGPYSVTDLALTPAGDVLALERHYSPVTGVQMRIRLVSRAAITPGAVLDGPVLVEADNAYTIDNMEGIASCTAPDNQTLIFVLSDDNFNPAQRTLLLRFALPAEASGGGAALLNQPLHAAGLE